MKRKIFTSIAASTVVLGALVLSGCGGSSTPVSDGSSDDSSVSTPDTTKSSALIEIQTDNGTRTTVDPTTGGTVVVRTNDDGTNNVATVVHSELNECTNATSDTDGDGVICGPKEGVTYVFQSDFGKLGGPDVNGNPADGGVLLFDALTAYNGQVFDTPVEGNKEENRIQEVYIPTNYIKLTDSLKSADIDTQYNAMREYLANVCNMQCMAAEPDNNPYFRDGKTKGRFLATFVMWFTKGTGEDTLKQKFETDGVNDLEYLTVQFELDVEQVDNNSSKLRFTSPADTKVVFTGKKAGQGGLVVEANNDIINSVVHESADYVHPSFTINMAKYFDKLIEKGDSEGVSDYAKSILVENAQHPWPVKIYGSLHEMNDDDTFEKSFVRNPSTMDAELFGLTVPGVAYSTAYDKDPKNTVKAIKFNIVYPGGEYNQLED